MSTEIDPVQFGELIGTVNALKKDVESLTNSVESLSQQITGGKGVVVGMLIAAGGLGAAASKAIEHFLKG